MCSLAFPSSALEAPQALAALVWRVVTNAASIIHRGARGQCYTISLCESFFVCKNILTAKSIHRPLQGGRGGTMLDNLQRATFVRADAPSVGSPIVVHSVRNHHLWTIRHLCGVNPRCPSVPIQWPTVLTKHFVASIFGVPVWEGTASLISAPIIDHSDQLTGTRKC